MPSPKKPGLRSLLAVELKELPLAVVVLTVGFWLSLMAFFVLMPFFAPNEVHAAEEADLLSVGRCLDERATPTYNPAHCEVTVRFRDGREEQRGISGTREDMVVGSTVYAYGASTFPSRDDLERDARTTRIVGIVVSVACIAMLVSGAVWCVRWLLGR